MSNGIAPTCCYCGVKLTDNELDFESGTYYSAHSGCVHSVADRNFIAANGKGYSTAKRAIEVTEGYARVNHWASYLTFVDGEVVGATMDKEDRRAAFWLYSPDLAREVGMRRPIVPYYGTVAA